MIRIPSNWISNGEDGSIIAKIGARYCLNCSSATSGESTLLENVEADIELIGCDLIDGIFTLRLSCGGGWVCCCCCCCDCNGWKDCNEREGTGSDWRYGEIVWDGLGWGIVSDSFNWLKTNLNANPSPY